ARHNIQKILVLQPEQASLELALLALFFGDRELVGLRLASLEFPAMRIAGFIFCLPLTQQAGINDNILLGVKRMDRKNAASQRGEQAEKQKGLFHTYSLEFGNTKLAMG